METAISIKDLKKSYKAKQGNVDALKGVSFDIKKGEFFGLLGPNGAGKSTLINIIAGVVQKTGGSITVNGMDLETDPTGIKHVIGVVPQEIAFDAFLNIKDTLKYQFGYYGLPYDEAYMTQILKDLDLLDKLTVKPRMLSGGMKRRFMIAKALVHRPSVLFLDEPTAGVDVELRHDLYDLVRKLNESGVTIILTSHYLEEVELLCERIGIINKGGLVALDNKKSLKDRFQSTRQFVAALTDASTRVPESLARFKPELNGSELTLTFDESEYKDVLKAVADADLPVMHVKIVEPSLEDVFVSLTSEA